MERLTEGTIFARSKRRSIYTGPDDYIYNQYRVRAVSGRELADIAERYIFREMHRYHTAYITERQTITVAGGETSASEWEIVDWAATRTQAIRSTLTETNTWESLDETHRAEVERYRACQAARAELQRLRNEAEAILERAQADYVRVLKEHRLYKAAIEGRAPQAKIDKIRSELRAKWEAELERADAAIEAAEAELERLENGS